MYGLDALNPENYGYRQLVSDAEERRASQVLFDRALGRARRRRLWARLTGKRQGMLPLKPQHSTLHYTGLRLVALDDIQGTENRADEFDSAFYPLAEHLEARWMSVAMAHMKGLSLPPVELILVNNTYYVRDGHHRISVARMMGQREIEAIVLVLEERAA
jgi:hypothetical protein